ncbi:hypothetical protein GCM10017687_30210 [Streptomyces echinatus]
MPAPPPNPGPTVLRRPAAAGPRGQVTTVTVLRRNGGPGGYLGGCGDHTGGGGVGGGYPFDRGTVRRRPVRAAPRATAADLYRNRPTWLRLQTSAGETDTHLGRRTTSSTTARPTPAIEGGRPTVEATMVRHTRRRWDACGHEYREGDEHEDPLAAHRSPHLATTAPGRTEKPPIVAPPDSE